MNIATERSVFLLGIHCSTWYGIWTADMPPDHINLHNLILIIWDECFCYPVSCHFHKVTIIIRHKPTRNFYIIAYPAYRSSQIYNMKLHDLPEITYSHKTKHSNKGRMVRTGMFLIYFIKPDPLLTTSTIHFISNGHVYIKSKVLENYVPQ